MPRGKKNVEAPEGVEKADQGGSPTQVEKTAPGASQVAPQGGVDSGGTGAVKPAGKQAVTYKVDPYSYIRQGERGFVLIVNHPDTFNVTNGRHATTTEVLSYDTTTGVFETKNSIYTPVKAGE